MPRSVYDAYRATAQYVSPDGRTVQFLAGLRAGNQQSTAAMNATPAVRAAVTSAAQRSGATASGVAGQAAALYDVTQTADHDMVTVIPVAVLAIALLLGLVLRSLIAPFYLVASIAASYLAAIGLTTLLVIDLGGQDGLIFVLPFLMFVFLLALGEDYNILIMTRIREEARHLPVREAVVRAIGRTGPTVTSAGLILAGTFGVFALAGGAVMGGRAEVHRARPGPGRADGHVRGPDAARAVRGRPARPLELVAVAAQAAQLPPLRISAWARSPHVLHLPAARAARRVRQAIFIALGLALGIGLVITVTAASSGVKNSQATCCTRCTAWEPTSPSPSRRPRDRGEVPRSGSGSRSSSSARAAMAEHDGRHQQPGQPPVRAARCWRAVRDGRAAWRDGGDRRAAAHGRHGERDHPRGQRRRRAASRKSSSPRTRSRWMALT